MKPSRVVVFGLSLCLAGAAPGWWAFGQSPKSLPPCESGYQWVVENSYKDVERYVCKMVPEVKKVKKIVYSSKDDPFCLQHHGIAGILLGGQCDCPSCNGPFSRKQLVKKEIICEEQTTKCVIEKIVEKVPCTVLRKVPCTSPVPSSPIK